MNTKKRKTKMANDAEAQYRTWHVAQHHPGASDDSPGTPQAPLRSISAVAALAGPGDTVLIHEGVYRERVAPARGGEDGRPITYAAAPGETVCLRGSEVFNPDWRPWGESSVVLYGSLEGVPMGAEAYQGCCDESVYGDFNPYHLNFNRAVVARPHGDAVEKMREGLEETRARIAELESRDDVEERRVSEAANRLEIKKNHLHEMEREAHRKYRTTMGQVFLDGEPMPEVEAREELERVPGAWMVDPEGEAILFHPPAAVSDINAHLVEISVRHTVFAPLRRHLGHIVVRGLTIEHAANHFPTWGQEGWAQAGALSCRSGHHWVIEDCTVRHAKGVGIDCGSEGGRENMEFPGESVQSDHRHLSELARNVGHHRIEGNRIVDNGHCGIAGIGHYGTQVRGNVIERNNRDGYTSPWWEFAGIKFHFFYDGLIEGNLIRDNETHGIWLDNQWRGSRVTRNVIVNNMWSGINIEYGRGPLLIDNNVIALTRQGDGVYGHDLADITVAHNLLYANANFGAWFAFGTPRVKPEDGCWDLSVYNNLILGNRAGAVAWPLPWEAAGNNTGDGNLYMGGGQYLDEGSGPQSPLFQITSVAHMGSMQRFLSFPAMSRERLLAQVTELLEKAGIPEDRWPNLETWTDHALLDFDLWKAVTSNDSNSGVISAIRDGLNTRRLNFQILFDDEINRVTCETIPEIDRDFFGNPMPADNLQPGPFQNIRTGEITRLSLWPHQAVKAVTGA
ncbi:MAG: right-handed parallel beta-helix repeat-containing protein [Phycisphaerae bacterium]|nr:right-handed parallel beta-helix repeat-containing protein [Phycisphaerae bacterium]